MPSEAGEASQQLGALMIARSSLVAEDCATAASAATGNVCLPTMMSLVAHSGRAVEVRAVQAGTGDHGPPRPAAPRRRGLEPLDEEVAQPRLPAVALHRHPLLEGGFELRLADPGPAVSPLDM